jgi:endonuclease/exonuclease/phosphatase family metal-dependent hydrolase
MACSKPLAILAAAGLLCLAGCGPEPLTPREPTPGVPHFKVATYNVLSERSGDEETIATVGDIDADILCLQEVTPEWRDVLVERYSDDYPYMLFRDHTGASGLGVLSRYPLTGSELLFFGEWHPAWRVNAETPAGWLQLLLVHLRANFDQRGTANVVDSFVSSSTDHRVQTQSFVQGNVPDMPTIVLGDFNEGPDGAAVEYLESLDFQNALPLYRPGQFTWRYPSLGNQMNTTIDHILFDGYMEPLNAYVLVEGNSDHIPVVAHLEASRPWPDLDYTPHETMALRTETAAP